MDGVPDADGKSPFCRDSPSWLLPQVGGGRQTARGWPFSRGARDRSRAIAPLGCCRRRAADAVFVFILSVGVGCLSELRGAPGAQDTSCQCCQGCRWGGPGAGQTQANGRGGGTAAASARPRLAPLAIGSASPDGAGGRVGRRRGGHQLRTGGWPLTRVALANTRPRCSPQFLSPAGERCSECRCHAVPLAALGWVEPTRTFLCCHSARFHSELRILMPAESTARDL
jgi:hypothetical protein